MTDERCPCGLRPAWAAPEAHDNPQCEHRADVARLRLVRPDERAVDDLRRPRLVQIADMPGAYAVRRGGDPDALINRGNSGDWYVMYGHDPAAGDWRGSAVLPGRLDDDGAARIAAELADAHALGVEGWAPFLARAAMDGEPVLALARAHSPNVDHLHSPDTGDALCAGELDAGVEFAWVRCPTVQLLAGVFGLRLPSLVDPSSGRPALRH